MPFASWSSSQLSLKSEKVSALALTHRAQHVAAGSANQGAPRIWRDDADQRNISGAARTSVSRDGSHERALWTATVAKVTGIFPHRDSDTDAGNRRDDRRIFRCGSGAVATTAVQGFR